MYWKSGLEGNSRRNEAGEVRKKYDNGKKRGPGAWASGSRIGDDIVVFMHGIDIL